ncbi:uncharacterized protein LOC112539491 [Tetranychus urticae]|uniref:F-box domain-containing protein n=1 Tax=Tetranychus urticae TaxID=32264 RepID=T1JRS6_TETUR|nr:uncharacterized protein LOC112539491 [Tetranychus urticae]
MFINELPDDCLLIIFGQISGLDDLVNCYKVCNKWSQLITERTRKVKYLVEHRFFWNRGSRNYPFDYVYYGTKEPIDGTCLSTLFPNLIIADFSDTFIEKVKHEEIVTLVKNMKSCKGLIHQHSYFYPPKESIFQYCDELEMVSTNYIDQYIANKRVNIKQLNLWDYNLSKFTRRKHYFRNLERLHIYSDGDEESYYHVPRLRRLKILELYLLPRDDEDIYYGFKFMDSFRNLQSAHIYLLFDDIFVDESLKHESLRDLVIEFYISEYNDNYKWNEWKSLFTKYPNLKHLALRSNWRLKNDHVKQLVRILPNLVLFDARGCRQVTQEAASYVQDYNRLHGRSIKFYFVGNYREIHSDWPHLSTKTETISQGFDFMKHCFLKDFGQLSTFLISNEYRSINNVYSRY